MIITPRDRRSRKIISLITAGFAAAYIAAKIQFALQGRLGVHGGPSITDADIARYGGAEQIAMAQWGNVGAGVLILALTVTLPRVVGKRRWHRWIAAIPLLLIGLSLVQFGVSMIINGAATGRGGYPFGIYSVVWGALECLLGVLTLSSQRNAVATTGTHHRFVTSR